jgi:hypothetical protein
MGFIMSSILISTNGGVVIHTNYTLLTIFLHGLLSGGGVWLTHTIQEMFERAFEKENPE